MKSKKNNNKDQGGSDAVDEYLKQLEKSIKEDRVLYRPPTEKQAETQPQVQQTPPAPPPQPAPPPIQQPEIHAPPPVQQPQPPAAQEVAPTPPPEGGRAPMFNPGDIIKMDDGSICIYNGPVKGKEYDMTLFLQDNGGIDARGIVIYLYDCEKIGNLPPLYFEKLRHQMAWTRDLIVYHLDKYEWCKHIKEPTKPAEKSAAGTETPTTTGGSSPSTTAWRRAQMAGGSGTEKTAPEGGSSFPKPEPKTLLLKGRRLSIKMGPKAWEAVYWGKDDLGHLLAHHTHGEWSLLHLDLERFANSITYHDLMTPEEVEDMEQIIMAKYAEK